MPQFPLCKAVWIRQCALSKLYPVPGQHQGIHGTTLKTGSYPSYPRAVAWCMTDATTQLWMSVQFHFEGGGITIQYSFFIFSFGINLELVKEKTVETVLIALDWTSHVTRVGWSNQDSSVVTVLPNRLQTAFWYPQMSPSDLFQAQDPVQAPPLHNSSYHSPLWSWPLLRISLSSMTFSLLKRTTYPVFL